MNLAGLRPILTPYRVVSEAHDTDTPYDTTMFAKSNSTFEIPVNSILLNDGKLVDRCRRRKDDATASQPGSRCNVSQHPCGFTRGGERRRVLRARFHQPAWPS